MLCCNVLSDAVRGQKLKKQTYRQDKQTKALKPTTNATLYNRKQGYIRRRDMAVNNKALTYRSTYTFSKSISGRMIFAAVRSGTMTLS
jgi:hypothetical protein